MTIRLPLIALLLLACLTVRGQQLSRYSMPWLDILQFNPAYAGLDNSLSVTGTYRSQWGGLEGAPEGQRFSAHLPIYFLSSGFGVEAERDQLGARSLNRFSASYNYQFVRGASVISLGIRGAYQQVGLDGSLLRTTDGIYEDNSAIIHNDDLLPTSDQGAGALSLEAGLYYQGPVFELGLSARNLNTPVLGFPGLDYRLGTQYHGFATAELELFRDWEVLPFIFAVSDGTQTQLSGGLRGRFRENITAGAAYRSGGKDGPDAVVVTGGFNLSDRITVAYAYDITLSSLRTVQDGSHEITIKYNLRKQLGAGIPPPIIYFPRTKQ